MDDLISRAAAIEALGECPYNWNDWPEEIQAVDDWESHKEAIENIPAVDAIPVDWIFEQMQILHELHNKNEYVLQWLMELWQREQGDKAEDK